VDGGMTDQAPTFLTGLIRAALGRETNPGAQAEADETQSPRTEAQQTDVAPDVPADRATAEFDPGIVGVLAEKVLRAWLQNRYQLLFPFALNLRRLDQRQAELLVHAMIAAAEADGSFDRRERERIEGTLSLVDPSEDERAFLEKALSRPRPLNDILSEVHDVETGALVYAASLMALDERKPVNRYYLKYLAARLQLSEELTGSLEQRYRA
jgi:uncharacterized membrane protein YebE (DUF533 family)